MKALPRIPKVVWSGGGPVQVRRMRRILDPSTGQTLLGRYDTERRVILLRTGLDRRTAWITLRHEQLHAILFDADVHLAEKQEEAVCASVAAALIGELR